MDENTIDRIIRLLKNKYRFDKNDLPELTVIANNYLIDNIKEIKINISHDGYDCDGPQSNLYDLFILHEKNNKRYLSEWHREQWFRGSDEDYIYSHEKTEMVVDNFNLKK